MRIAYNNLTDAATLTASTADAGYPVANIQDQRLGTTWRTTTRSTESVIIDLGSTVPTSVVAVLGHNISAGAVVTLTGSPDSGFTTGLTSVETVAYDSGIMLKFYTEQSRRYWKINIEEQASTGSYIEVARVWLGTYETVSPSSLADFRVTKKRSDTVVYGKHRQKFADPGRGWRRFDLDFPETGSSMLTVVQTVYDTVGNHSSFIFCNFDDVRDWDLVEPCYVSIDGEVGFTAKGGYRATYRLSLEEDL